jgi:hypothetical protein
VSTSGAGETAIRPHTADGSEQLTEAQALAYLEESGYGAEAAALADTARRFPGTYGYTSDRHRYIVFIMPGGYWKAGDCEASEERIKSLSAARRPGGAWW